MSTIVVFIIHLSILAFATIKHFGKLVGCYGLNLRTHNLMFMHNYRFSWVNAVINWQIYIKKCGFVESVIFCLEIILVIEFLKIKNNPAMVEF